MVASVRFAERYELLGRIGAGGMAEVLLARDQPHPSVSRLVVIKRVHPHLAQDPGFVDAFMDEVRIAARMQHANVVHHLDVGMVDGIPYLVMEHLEGNDVASFMKGLAGDSMPMDAAVAIVLGAARGLTYAHNMPDDRGRPLDVVHRDVSPQNIFVTLDGTPKVLDFGIAASSSKIGVTAPGIIKGKVGYMAPEQISGGAVDHRADLWALGVMLWELLAGRRLLRRDTLQATVMATAGGTIPPPSSVAAAVPATLDALVMELLERDPERRLGSGSELVKRLEAILVHDLRSASATETLARLAVRFRNTTDTQLLTQPESTATRQVGSAPKTAVTGDSDRSPDPALDETLGTVTQTAAELSRRTTKPGRGNRTAMRLVLGAVTVVGLSSLVFTMSRRSSNHGDRLPARSAAASVPVPSPVVREAVTVPVAVAPITVSASTPVAAVPDPVPGVVPVLAPITAAHRRTRVRAAGPVVVEPSVSPLSAGPQPATVSASEASPAPTVMPAPSVMPAPAAPPATAVAPAARTPPAAVPFNRDWAE